MKVLVLGASGFLGGHVYHRLVKNNLLKDEIIGTSHSLNTEKFHRININDEKKFEEFYRRHNPKFVIWTLMSPDNEHDLIQIGLVNLLKIIDKDTKLIYVSTDGIFTHGEGSFSEEAKPTYLDTKNPLSNYTNAKLDGEKLIREKHKNHIIIRTGPLYGQDLDGNWDTRVSVLKTTLTAGKVYKRADNLFKTFVHVEDLAIAIIELLAIDYNGILHIGPKTKESYYTFNIKMATKLNLNKTLIIPDRISIEEAKEKGISLDTSLNTAKCNSMLSTKFREV